MSQAQHAHSFPGPAKQPGHVHLGKVLPKLAQRSGRSEAMLSTTLCGVFCAPGMMIPPGMWHLWGACSVPPQFSHVSQSTHTFWKITDSSLADTPAFCVAPFLDALHTKRTHATGTVKFIDTNFTRRFRKLAAPSRDFAEFHRHV